MWFGERMRKGKRRAIYISILFLVSSPSRHLGKKRSASRSDCDPFTSPRISPPCLPLALQPTPVNGMMTDQTNPLPHTPRTRRTTSLSSLAQPAPFVPLRSSLVRTTTSHLHNRLPYLISLAISTRQQTERLALPEIFTIPLKLKTLSLTTADLPEHPSPVIRYSTTAEPWSIQRATSVTSVSLLPSFPSSHQLMVSRPQHRL